MSHIAWDGIPPSRPQVQCRVVHPTPAEPVIVRLLGVWVGVWLHWMPPEPPRRPRGRSLPCTQDRCPLDHRTDPPFWYGYAPCQKCTRIEEPANMASPNPPSPPALRAAFEALPRHAGHSQPVAGKYTTVWAPAVCPITESMATGLLHGVEPRGCVIILSRSPRSRSVEARLLGRTDPGHLPEAFDPIPVLLRMWGRRMPERGGDV